MFMNLWRGKEYIQERQWQWINHYKRGMFIVFNTTPEGSWSCFNFSRTRFLDV